MMKEIKKSNEGFSLVELIIVIAIMAILVGIIALQVVPYMEKSREGKDYTQLDSCFSAFQTAVAENEVKGNLTAWKYGSGSATEGSDKIDAAIQKSLGMSPADLLTKLSSQNCVDTSKCDGLWLEKTGTTITVTFGMAIGTPVIGEYNQKKYTITSGTASAKPTTT